MANNRLTFIPNQPIIFDLEDGSKNGFISGGKNPVFLRDDFIELQIKREPCGLNLVCSNSEPILGDELIVNGDFATDLTDWDYGGGSPWYYNSGAVGSLGINDQLFYQERSELTAGKKYRVSFTIKNYVSGDVRTQLGQGAGANASDYFGSNGVKEVDLYFNDSDPDKIIAFSGDSFIGDIDDVSLKEIEYCFTGAGWIGNEEGIYTHLTGFNTPLEPVVTPIAVDNIYSIRIRVTDMSAGSVSLIVGDSISSEMTTNDTYHFHLAAGTSNALSLLPTSDFDGKIEFVEIYEQTELSYIWLLDSDGNEVVNLQPFVSYVADRINIRFSATEIQDRGLASIANGCYRIAVQGICNPANANMAPNPLFSGGDTLSIEGWEKNNGSIQYDFSGGEAKLKYNGSGSKSPILRSVEIPELFAGNFTITVNISTNTDTTGIGLYVMLDNYKDAPTPTVFRTLGEHSVDIDGYDPDGIAPPTAGNRRIYIVANFQYDGAPHTGEIGITSIDLRPRSEDEVTDLSNVFEIQQTTDIESKWIEAYNYCSGFGFDFRQFKLAQRVPVLKFNPKYPNKQSVYNYTTGSKERTGAERDKLYQVKTARVDEITHDCLSMQLLCNTLTIDSQEYFFEGKSYEPKWRSDGRSALASAQFELSTQPSIVRSNFCGECQAAPSFVPCETYYESAIDFSSAASPGSGAGWYMKDGEDLLEYYDDSAFTGATKTGTGYVECLMGTPQSVPHSGPYRFNNANSDWEPIIKYEYITDIDTDEFEVSIRIPVGCVVKLEYSTDSGITYQDLTIQKSSAEWLSGVSINKPDSGATPFRFRAVVQCSICIYTGSEVLLYE